MMPHEARGLGYYAASRWLHGAVAGVLLVLLMLGLLRALEDAKAQAERQVVELTVRNMRTGLQLAMGETLMQQREHEIATWVGSNPIQWLGAPPAGYQGECGSFEGRALEQGGWCFDKGEHQLYYRPRNAKLRDGKGAACDRLSWLVARSDKRDPDAKGDSFAGLRIQPAASCVWVQVGN